MTTRITLCLTALALIAALTIPGHVTAQHQKAAAYPYIAINTGTLGGPAAGFCGGHQIITNGGAVVTGADTAITDTDYPNGNPSFSPNLPGDISIGHAALWNHGILTDLGALPGNNISCVFEMNARGEGSGDSEIGTIDPINGYPELRATLTTDGHVIDLGTLGGYESYALAINNGGQVVGMAANATPDPWTLQGYGSGPGSFSQPWGTQIHAVLWQQGVMHDLGTLGGPDSLAYTVNERGQITGASFTTAISNVVTGIPTEDPFLWTSGHMHDLGTLGGAFGVPDWMNNAGEVTGQSDLAGDLAYHPFLWNGTMLQDLGTFGGNYGAGDWMNEAGDVSGWATTSGDAYAHAFLWKNGVLTDLDGATSTLCDYGDSINARDQIVGGSCGTNPDGWLWENGTRSDLNTLVAASGIQLGQAFYINDRGEIAVSGTMLATGYPADILLVPTALAQSEGLTSNMPPPSTSGVALRLHGTPLACFTTPLWRANRPQGCGRFRRGF